MYQPAGIGGHRAWRRSNIQVAGIMIAGNCVLCIVFFGFGLLLVGTFSYATSISFEPKPSDRFFFRNTTNVPRLIGKIFLGVGAIVFFVGLVLLYRIIRQAKDQARNNQGQVETMVLAGPTYPGSNYTATQPYANHPNTGTQFQPYYSDVGQSYPPAPGQGQPYQPVISGQGQPYPQGPGQPYSQGPGQPYSQGPGQSYPQGPQTYPPVTGQGQPYSQGSGQTYPPVAGQGQPYPQGQGQHYSQGPGQTYQQGPQSYPPVTGQGQPYPQGPQPYPLDAGQGQPYPPFSKQDQAYPPAGSGQSYPPTGGNPERTTDPRPLPYNPGYPGSGHPQPDAPPPYSNY